MSWRGIQGVVEKDIRRDFCWNVQNQSTVACERIRLPSAAQVVLGRNGAAERPFVLLTPHVISHDKDANRLVVGESILFAVQ